MIDSWIKSHRLGYYCIFFVILASGLGIRWYWSTEKVGLHDDEVASFSLAESLDGSYNRPVLGESEQTSTMTGMELKQFYLIHDNTLSGVFKDIRSMHHKMFVFDHTNFYYSILRIVFLGKDTYDTRSIIRNGVMLNLLFFILSFVVLWKILTLLYTNSIVVLSTLGCFSFMPGAISDAIFIRPYELQMLTVLLLVYWITKVYMSMNNGTWNYNVKNFIITAILLSAVLWTGYFMVILVAFLGSQLLWKVSKHGSLLTGFLYFGGTGVASLIICYILYRSYFVGFHGDGRIADKLFTSGGLSRLMDSALYWAQLLLKNTMPWPVLVVVGFTMWIKRSCLAEMPKFVLPILLYTFIVTLLAPFYTNRYIVAASPLLLLLIPAALCNIKRKKVQLLLSALIVLIYATNALQEENIDYLFKNSKQLTLLSENPGDVHFVQKRNWQLAGLVPFLSDDVEYKISTQPSFDDYKSGDVVAYAPHPKDKIITFPTDRFELYCKYYTYYIYKVK